MNQHPMAPYSKNADTPESGNPPSDQEIAVLACVLIILASFVVYLVVCVVTAHAAKHTISKQERASVEWVFGQQTVMPCRYAGTITTPSNRPGLEMSANGFKDLISMLWLWQEHFGSREATLPVCVGL